MNVRYCHVYRVHYEPEATGCLQYMFSTEGKTSIVISARLCHSGASITAITSGCPSIHVDNPDTTLVPELSSYVISLPLDNIQ